VVDEVGQGVKLNNAYIVFYFCFMENNMGRIARNDSFWENHILKSQKLEVNYLK
jgi:hypothetical protein